MGLGIPADLNRLSDARFTPRWLGVAILDWKEPRLGSDVRKLLNTMRSSRRAVCDELHSLPAASMTAETTWAGANVGVRFMLLRFADHEEEHALQIARSLAAHGFLQSKAQRALAAAEMTRGDLLATLVGLGDGDLDIAPNGEWPLRRTLAHIISAERSYVVNTLHAVVRFRQGQEWDAAPESLMPPPLDELELGSFSSLVDRLDEARERVMSELTGLADDELVARSVWWGRGVSAEFRLLRFAHHEREHTAHIHKWRTQVGRTPTEAQHLLGLGWRARGFLEGLLAGVPDSLLDLSASEGEETLRELLEHIMSSERYIWGQIRSATPVA